MHPPPWERRPPAHTVQYGLGPWTGTGKEGRRALHGVQEPMEPEIVRASTELLSLSLYTANSHTVTLSLQRGSHHGEPPRPLGLSRVHAAPLDPLEGEGDAVEAPLLGE